MPQIIITNLFNKTLDFDLNFASVLAGLQSKHIDWMHACGAKGRCTTCKMVVLKGMQNLSPNSAVERNYRSKGLLQENERLTCQAKLEGDITIRIPAESKFPHIDYSD